MAYLFINETDQAANAKGVVIQCTSALFNYQVLGGVVEFSGSNVPNFDIDDESHWQPIVTIQAGTPDSEPFRQHTWNTIRWKVVSGSSVQIYCSSGVSG